MRARHRRKLFRVLLPLPLSLFLAAQSAAAQEGAPDAADAPAAAEAPAPPEIEEIRVSISRRPMDVQDVSASVTAFDEELMFSANIDNQEDVAFLAPNVVTKGARFNSLSVRGLSSGITSQESVALHTNGVFTGPTSFFDVESVEFVRGPSGSLYGRNATGGAINIRQKKPEPWLSTWGEVNLANYDQLRVRAGVNVPLLGTGDERLAMRVNVNFNQYDGWLDNEFETRKEDPGNADEYGFSVSLRAELSEDTSVWLRGGYAKLRNDITPSRPLIDRYPVGQLPAGPVVSAFGMPIRSDPYDGLVGMVQDLATGLPTAIDNSGQSPLPGTTVISLVAATQGVTFDEAARSIVLNGATILGTTIDPIIDQILADPSVIGTAAAPLDPDRSKVRLSVSQRGEPEIVTWSLDGEIVHALRDMPLLGDVEITLRGGVFDRDLDVLIDLDGTELTVLDIVRENPRTRWTGELQIVSQNEGPFNWVAGFFYFQDRIRLDQVVHTLFDDLPEVNEQRLTGAAPFAHVFWDVTDDVTLEGGIRWSRDSVEVEVFREGTGRVARPDSVCYRGHEVFRERTGEFSAHWRWAEDRNVYAKWVRGYRPGGLNFGEGISNAGGSGVCGRSPSDPAIDQTLAQAAAAFRSFGAESIEAFEVGSKNTFLDGLLQLNLTAFHYDYTDLQVPFITVAGVQTTNAASATIRGVELEAQLPLPVLDGGLVFANVAYLHAEYDELCTDDPFEFSSVSDPGCPAATSLFDGQRDLEGNRLPDAPRWSAALMAVVNHEMGEWGRLRFMVKSAFRDDYYIRPENLDEIDRIHDFTRTDVRIIWQSPSERWSVHLYAENLEGDFTFASSLVGPEISGGLPVGLVIPLSPRIYGVQLEWKWGGE